MTEWRPVAGFEGRYEVSRDGQVRSLPRRANVRGGCTRSVPGRILTQRLGAKGYPVVFLSDNTNGRSRNRLVHRLVAEAFIPSDPNKPYVNHKNGIKTDHSVENLEWVSARENTHHAMDTGLMPTVGEKHPRCTLSDSIVVYAREKVSSGTRVSVIAKEFGVNYDTLLGAVIGRTWTHLPGAVRSTHRLRAAKE